MTFGKLCIISGYLTKSGNWSNSVDVLTVPSDLAPGTIQSGAVYAVGHGAAADKVARLYFTGNVLTIGNPSATMPNVVFTLVYTID